MSLAQLLITAVVLEGRSQGEVAGDYGVSRQWVNVLVGRYRGEGEAAFSPRSRRPQTSPRQTPRAVEDEIVELRKELDRAGHEAGAATIAFHLAQRCGSSPAVSTIWRVLTDRGFVTAQPHKRPRSSCPTNAGKPTSRTGRWLMGVRWRSVTSSMTTPGCVSPAPPLSCSTALPSTPRYAKPLRHMGFRA